MNRPLLVVGSINMDLLVRTTRIPERGETVLGEDFRTGHGGKGANQAVGIARLGYPVTMVGSVGQDTFGPDLRNALTAEGVDTSAVHSTAGSSGVALIQVEPDGANRITVAPGANAALTPAALEQHHGLFADAAMVLSQLEIPLEIVEALAGMCQEACIPFMLDPAPAQPLSGELLQRTHWLTPNATEALTLLSRPVAEVPGTPGDALQLAHKLKELGPDAVLLKLGALGAVALFGNEAPVYQPAFAVEACDTTAAGDATNAAFAVGLTQGLSVSAALKLACAAGALCASRPGAQAALPTQTEIEVFLAAQTMSRST